ncbi:ABC transporter substrate-binding protein [Streptomyces sp. WI04-05B]|uniref:ABC transporter substrate-binding protein n=1 Tax=Streptomyces TaxID=1883 RepID=UPI00299FFD91|nr:MULTISPECIES: ABC transporter substrate-binding protein [unclassified Streptomyces]MDX2548599.1 ABC transporter substrate-binding protein [Streptomyces sp. WI04-05B]MDX2588087.1 ABC transporter substrate-binding protein [Streptomyces sp. WI04-05A]MDX3751731.1 ABC transporter substrate-binding protein [Streptomyces sp. AK08-02]
MRNKPGAVRRCTLRAAGLPLVLGLTLTACTSGTTGGVSGSDGGTPVTGGTLTYAVDQTQPSLDPAASPADITGVVGLAIFDSLVAQTGPTTFKPWLAKRWEISPDGKTYTFHLRTGVAFQDGTPFDAAAVKKTLDHVVDPATKSQYAGSLISAYKRSRVVDEATVKVELSRPFAPFLQALSTPYLGIQSPKALALPVSRYKPVGTGPFSFVSWAQQKNIVLVRNPHYTTAPPGAKHTGPAHLDRINIDLITEDTTRYGALTSHQVQAIGSVPPIDAKPIEAAGLQLLRHQAPGANWNVYFNVSRGVTKDVRVRQALQAAVDVPTLVKSVYFGQYQAARNTISPNTGYYDTAAESSLQAYDPAKADQLLDAAGWTGRNADGYRTKDGKELAIEWPYTPAGQRNGRDTLAEGLQAQAKKVGINLKRPSVAVGTYVSDIQKGTYDMLDYSFVRADPDILRLVWGSDQLVSKGGENASYANSRELDAWLEEAATTKDENVARRDYAKAQAYVLKNAYLIPGYVEQTTIGASDKLHGVDFTPQSFPTFYDAWLAK